MSTGIVSSNTTMRHMTENVSVTKMSQEKKNRLQVPSFIGNALCKTCFTLHICVFSLCDQ